MSTMVKSLLGDYSQAVSQFQAASLGGYSGPSTPIGLLGDMVGSVDGIKTDDLVSSTASAMGARRPRRGGNGLRDFLLGTVLSLAGGALMDHLRGVQDDFEKEREEADDLVESAQQCSEAIEDVVDVSDSAVAELISAVIPLLNILTMLLQRHPLGKAIVPVISSIGGDLIDQTNDTITQTCRDRDTAIENCYGEFERRCSEVCERELPETPPEPECGCEDKPKQCAQPAPEPCAPTKPAQSTEPAVPAQPSPAPAPSTPAPPQQPVEQGVEQPVAPQEEPAPTRPAAAPEKECPPDEEKPQPTKPSQPPSASTEAVAQPKPESTASEAQHTPCGCHAEKEAQSCGCSEQQREIETTKPADAGVESPTEPVQQEVIDCPADMEPVAEEKECTEEPAEGEDCETPEQPPVAEPGECKPEESCCGSLGILGVGVAILGLGLLAEAAVDFIENLPEPEPVPEPVPEPEPCSPPAPEPAPDNGVTPPPPELNNVPEPEAPPEKLAHMQAAEAPVPAPDPAPAPAPEPAPGPAPATEAAPDIAPQESSETSSVHARKAGQW
ncbi:zinc metalloprotease [Corynebacterium sp. HMSC072A02]|uniref:zinc metalloprotease n=1 Tax=Corynebacterium sp. HMSC072A02 TaxID=1715177 RepID=UPI0008A631CB|nr:zinc metalloprotease [Corynebacterium sp. HMSC072A02]OFM32140.1 zinc metalloprotease [Corynebacterium sp. HMSC072A02]